eukprot:Blabericola_migrator_1__5576@NODE_2839_length_2296_cov_30_711978_g1781_i0_p2_GENE_NODE_2839_length_2296_cov_30_711978_g1781_i0NODE_2839_length_2296_cov_30_711978_g1781_i0_p2_ORF_typecomplete_len231_score48_30RL10P_insert/PF17777_1/6_2e20Ribosomal_L10/PF00466_20/6_8e16_NODE_2839_length_2296_cov_30_711978_g1781_i09521644
MPKAKRAKVVNLTQVRKKGKEHKVKIIDKVRESVANHRFVHVITITNASSDLLQNLREHLKPGRLINCKHRLIQVALGQNPESAVEDNIWKLAALATGDCALLATDDSIKVVKEKLAEHSATRYALPGTVATKTITLSAGGEALESFPHSVETTLRKLGLPTVLKDGRILLVGDYTVCKEGQPLSVNASKILRQLGHRLGNPEYQMGEFRVNLKGSWDRKTKKVTLNKAE